jgi:predicted porin
MAGFQASAMLVLNDTNQTQTTTSAGYAGGKDNQNGWGLGANYTFKKLTATAAYQSFTAQNPNGAISYTVDASKNPVLNSTTATTAGTPVAYGLATGTNVKDNQTYVGATYDFGILKAYAGWIDRKVTSQINSNQYAKRTAQEIGVRGNFTPKIEAYASVGNGRITRFGANSPTANIVGYQLGTNYILSKRTNLYAIYGATGTSNASGLNTTYNANNYAIGMRHTF